MKPSNLPFAPTIIALALLCTSGAAWSQTAPGATTGTTPPTLQTSPTPATASTPTNKLVSTFTPLAGSPENATSLVNGLRTGSAITLTSAPGGAPGSPPGGEAATFTSPTKPMGYGNIRIAMSLAEAQLASQGIPNPTPTQLQGALMGTTTVGPGGTTTTQGILQMRASGMGWGKIAQSMGYKLGPIMSGKQTFTTTTATGGTATTATGAATGHGKSSVTTAAGTTAAQGKGGVTTAAGGNANAGGHGKSQVVTAAGGGGGQVTTGLGHGNSGGASSGVVSAAGGKGGGGGQGAANGKGGGKP